MHADAGVRGRELICPLHDCEKIIDDDLARCRISEIEPAFSFAPAVIRRLRKWKPVAVGTDVAVPSDVIEDEVDAGRETRKRGGGGGHQHSASPRPQLP